MSHVARMVDMDTIGENLVPDLLRLGQRAAGKSIPPVAVYVVGIAVVIHRHGGIGGGGLRPIIG